MRKHNGMRPQDIVVLLKIVALDGQTWQAKDLANSLHISPSEISESLNRSQLAGLVDQRKERVNRTNFFEFLQHGLQYVFPQHPGTMVNGVATAHGHGFMKQYFSSDLVYVWPDLHGEERGLAIEPLYPKQVSAVKEDPELYKLLALVDVIRVGKTREVKVALDELKKTILYDPQG